MTNSYESNRNRSQQIHYFNGGADQMCAQALFDAIRALDNGHFPKHVAQLSQELYALFDEIPIIDTEKQLGTLSYKSCGIITENDKNKNCTRSIPAPPFDAQPTEDDTDKSDAKERLALIRQQSRWHFSRGDLTLKQLAWAMCGKQAKTRNGVVGKSLYKITQLVEKLEQTMADNPDMNLELLCRMPGEKIRKEAMGPISPEMHIEYYKCDYAASGDGMTSFPVYTLSCSDGDIVEDVAEALSKGILTSQRIYPVMDRLTRKEAKESATFVPMASILQGRHNYDRLAGLLKKDCPELKELEEKAGEKFGRQSRSYIDNYMNGYTYDLTKEAELTVQGIYDATQVYYAYAAFKNKKTHEFLETAGYLIKDWEPDPDLWYRASKFMLPAMKGNAYYIKHLPERVLARHREIAYQFLQDMFASDYQLLHSKTAEKRRAILLRNKDN